MIHNSFLLVQDQFSIWNHRKSQNYHKKGHLIYTPCSSLEHNVKTLEIEGQGTCLLVLFCFKKDKSSLHKRLEDKFLLCFCLRACLAVWLRVLFK
jgi:hypothetical protein